METIKEIHQEALQALDGLVRTTPLALLPVRTPCVDWNVSQLVEHVVGLSRGFARALETGTGPVGAYGPRPVVEWEDSAATLREAVWAVPLDRQVQVAVVHPTARFAAADVLRMHVLDLLVHGWDLAVSSGRAAATPSKEALGILAAQARFIARTDRPDEVAAQFGPPRVAATAEDPTWPEVLRLLGRDPLWSARLTEATEVEPERA